VAVEADGSVRVKAPLDVPTEKLEAIVRLKASWILRHRRRQEDLPPSPRERCFESGEGYLYLGRQYRLKRVEGERLPERARELWPLIGVEPADVLLREPRQRWGSCDARGALRLNWRIVQAPRRLIDYVVLHELAHLVHADHGNDFWTLLGRALPDYEKRRDELRLLGRRLVW
jgi:predicted metal-dependent hydrolase